MLRIRLSIMGVFFLALFILSNSLTWAENWQQYGVDGSGEFYYDAESVTRSTTNTVKVWTKMVHSKENIKTLEKSLENLHYSNRLWEINCGDKKIRRLSKIAFSKDGKILISDNKEENWQSILSKSLSEKLYENVCR